MKRAIILSFLGVMYSLMAHGQISIQNASASIVYVDGVKYACSEAGIASAASAAGFGGSVHAEGCLTPFTWGSTLTITNPLNLYLPCTTMTVTAGPTGAFSAGAIWVESNDVHIHTCSGSAAGQAQGSGGTPNPAAQFLASGLGTTTNLIVTGIPLESRTSLAAGRLSGFTLDPIYINMNSVGNRAIYCSSCWEGVIDHPTIDNANCGTAADGAITIEGAVSGDANGTESYGMRLIHPVIGIAKVSPQNTWCHGIFFDARNGEVSFPTLDSASITGEFVDTNGSGGDSILIQAGSAVNDSFDKGIFVEPYVHNQSSGAYGIRMECPGNFLNQTGGRCSQNAFAMLHAERLFGQSASGVGIGCTQSGTANGAGCGGNILIAPEVGNYSTYIDYTNLGLQSCGLGDMSSPSFPIINCAGPIMPQPQVGTNAYTMALSPNETATASGQFLGALSIVPKVILGSSGNTNENIFGINLDCQTNGITTSGGTIATYACLNVNGDPPATGGGNKYAFNTNGGTVNTGKAIIGSGATITSSGAGGTMAAVIASGASILPAMSIKSGACGGTVTRAAPGVVTTDSIEDANNAAPSTADGLLKLNKWITNGNVNFNQCNPTASTQTPGGITVNWRVLR